MAYSSVYDAVVTIIAECLDIEKPDITRESHLFNDLGGDIFNAVEIQMRLEDEFDIKIEPEDGESLLIVGDIVDYLESKGATVGGSSGGNTGNSGSSSGMANMRFIPELLTTSPYPNSKKFVEGVFPAAYIYTDGSNYKAYDDVTFLYCHDQDTRDPDGLSTLAIYYADPDEAYEDAEDYVEWANDHPAFYRGRYTHNDLVCDRWVMFELTGSPFVVSEFLTPVITEEYREVGTTDLTQYCPIYEDLLKSVFETGFPSGTFAETKSQVLGSDASINRFSSYVMTSPGDVGGFSPNFLVFTHGTDMPPRFGNLSWNSSWVTKSVLFHPGYATTSNMGVSPSIFTSWMVQTGGTLNPAMCYFAVVDIDAINNGHPDDHGVVAVTRSSVNIPVYSPTCIFWGRTKYKGYNLIVPVAVVVWASDGSPIVSRTTIDWRSNMPF